MARLRPVRGPLVAALLAVPHRHQRLPLDARSQPAPRATDGPQPAPERRHAASAAPFRVGLDRAGAGQPRRARRRSRRRDGRARVRAAGVRCGAPVPPAPTAGRPHPPRGAALAAEEVAELLGTSVASVNSALQRARATMASHQPEDASDAKPLDDTSRALLDRYVDAFERYDMDSLTSLLATDATWNMPPYDLWLATHQDIVDWCLGPGIACRGSRLLATEANGQPAFAQYKPSPGGGYEPWSIQVLELSGDRIAGITFFLDTARFFPLFGFPLTLGDELHR